MHLDKAAVANLRRELEAALREVARKTGVDFRVGTIRYDAVSMRCKVEGAVRGAAGTSATVPADPDLVALRRNAYILGPKFDQSKIYCSPTLGNVRVVGYRARSHKYPFIVLRVSDGRKYKLPEFSLRNIIDSGEVV